MKRQRSFKNAIADATAAAEGRYDHDLIERIKAVDAETRTVVESWPKAQRIALLAYASDMATDHHALHGPYDIASAMRFFLYGFQLGHDYVAKHGPVAGGEHHA